MPFWTWMILLVVRPGSLVFLQTSNAEHRWQTITQMMPQKNENTNKVRNGLPGIPLLSSEKGIPFGMTSGITWHFATIFHSHPIGSFIFWGPWNYQRGVHLCPLPGDLGCHLGFEKNRRDHVARNMSAWRCVCKIWWRFCILWSKMCVP